MITPIDNFDVYEFKRRKKGTNISDLMDFVESGEKAGLVDLRGRVPQNVYTMLSRVIRQRKLPLHVIKQGDEVYVVRKDPGEK